MEDFEKFKREVRPLSWKAARVDAMAQADEWAYSSSWAEARLEHV